MWICDCCSELNNDKNKKCAYCGMEKTVRGVERPLKRRKNKAPWYVFAATAVLLAVIIAAGVFFAKDGLVNAAGGEAYMQQDDAGKDGESAAEAGGTQNITPIPVASGEHNDSEQDVLADMMPVGEPQDKEDGDDESDYYDYDSENYVGCWERNDFSDFVVYDQEGQTISFIVVSYSSSARMASADIRRVALNKGSGTFRFTDSWGNTGYGTISFDGSTMELDMVLEYINNSNWAVDQASGTYTKFTDAIDMDILADHYGEAVEDNGT